MSSDNGNGKTAIKTAIPSPRSGIRLPLGAHSRNTGGKKGRSGRKPEWLVEFCDSLLATPKCRAAVRVILSDPSHPAFAVMWKTVSERGHGKPAQVVDKNVKRDVTVRVIFDDIDTVIDDETIH